MWRIKKLTELFGPCGKGWKSEIIDLWLESAPGGQISAFCSIKLYVKFPGDEEWSEPIAGIGGNIFVQHTKDGELMNDDCFKMAYTDAISVACKQLGFGADVYWAQDRTKYSEPESVKYDKIDLSAWEKLGYSWSDVEKYCNEKFGCGINALTAEQIKKLRALLKKVSSKYSGADVN